MKRFSPLARIGTAALALSALSAAISPALAEDVYPSKPIRVIVPFTAGSATDIIARAVGEGMRKELGQPIIVENKPGAGGTLGASQVATAQPDGYMSHPGRLHRL